MISAQYDKCTIVQEYIIEKSKPFFGGRKLGKGRFSGKIYLLSCNLTLSCKVKRLARNIHYNRSIPWIINSEISEGYASAEKTR